MLLTEWNMKYWMIAILAIIVIVTWMTATLITLSSIKKEDDMFVMSNLSWLFVTIIAVVIFTGIIFKWNILF